MRSHLIIAAAALSVAAAGAMFVVIRQRTAPDALVHTGSAQVSTTKDAAVLAPSTALDPLVQAIGTPPVAPTMKLDATIATAGGRVSVTFDAPVYSPENARSWIAIAKVGSPDSAYETWTFLANNTQKEQLSAPTVPGDYEVRMHDDYPAQTYHVIARVPFKVESGLAEDPNPGPVPSSAAAEHFTLKASKFEAGAEIFVKFPEPLIAKKGEKYWIAITRAGAPDSSYDGWQYIPASATRTSMQAPADPGAYEMRLHGNYPTKSTNVVHRVRFQVE